MFAVVVAVVAREDDERVFGQTQVVERLEQPANIVVDGRDAAEIAEVHWIGAVARLGLGSGNCTQGTCRRTRVTGIPIHSAHVEIRHWAGPGAGETVLGPVRRIERAVT